MAEVKSHEADIVIQFSVLRKQAGLVGQCREQTVQGHVHETLGSFQQTILAERLQELNPQYGARVIESFGQPEKPSTPG